MIALGRKFYDEIVSRLPAPLGADALSLALKRLQARRRRRADGSDRAPHASTMPR